MDKAFKKQAAAHPFSFARYEIRHTIYDIRTNYGQFASLNFPKNNSPTFQMELFLPLSSVSIFIAV